MSASDERRFEELVQELNLHQANLPAYVEAKDPREVSTKKRIGEISESLKKLINANPELAKKVKQTTAAK